ncbi:MAG: hypothetical protein KDD04_10090, partial [Sinomicrobium sp.]|nr:hypothetical protein [Sinomicrobium sp.]
LPPLVLILLDEVRFPHLFGVVKRLHVMKKNVHIQREIEAEGTDWRDFQAGKRENGYSSTCATSEAGSILNPFSTLIW